MPAGNLLYYALVALVIAVIAGLLGFGGIAGAAAGIAQILFYVFIIIFVVVLVMNFMGRGRGPTIRANRRGVQHPPGAAAANVLPVVRALQASGTTTVRGIAEALNARGIRTDAPGQQSQ